jgi:tRNA pseudouridine13 synthase
VRYLTEDLTGTGGRIKVHPDDFRVTEIPLYEPSGKGDHVYLYIEKSGIGSLEAADRIARAFGIPRHRVGMAGLKDAQAVTRQWMSLERVDADKAAILRLPSIKVLSVSRHRNRLKIGHLAGNRFEVRLRGCRPGARQLAERVLAVLHERGVPNWFDRQRFGTRGDNHLLGRALVLGQAKEFCDRFLGRPSEACDSPRLVRARKAYDAGNLPEAKKGFAGSHDHLCVLVTLAKSRDPARAMHALPKQLARLLVSAFQAHLFNLVLERRMDSLDRVELGDLAYIHPPVPGLKGDASPPRQGPAGAVFRVENPDAEAPRAARFEISPSGPIVGHRVTLASGRPGEIERGVLAAEGISPADFDRVKALRLRGDRRPLRVPIADVEVAPVGEDINVRFTLPSGAYATVALAEITKSEPT